MKNKICVKIYGATGSGKTTVAAILVNALAEHGCEDISVIDGLDGDYKQKSNNKSVLQAVAPELTVDVQTFQLRCGADANK